MAEPTYDGFDKTGGTLVDSTTNTGRGDRLVVWIDADAGSWLESMVVVRNVYDPVGPEPGYAVIEIPVRAASEKANLVALGDPWRNLLFGTRVCIGKQAEGYGTQWFWNGRVAIVDQDLTQDVLVVTAKDDRWMLSDVRVMGRFVVEPYEVSNNMTWQQGWKAIFNEDGLPNMMLSRVMDDDGIYIPVFCPPDWGLEPDDAPATEVDDLLTKAGYWTIGWIMRYLSIFYGPGAASYYPSSSAVVPKLCPSEIVWPRELGSVLDYESTEFWNEGRGSGRGQAQGQRRKGREVDADGHSIPDLIELMVSTAGGYSVGLEMTAEQDETTNKLTCSTTIALRSAINRGGVGSTLTVIRGGTKAQLELSAPAFTGGNIVEDASDMVTSMYGVGSLVKMERRIDTVVATLKGAWSSTSLAAMIAEGTSFPVTDAYGMRALFNKYFDVAALYNLDASWNFMADSSEVGYPLAKTPRPIMPQLLSWIGGQAMSYATDQCPILVEVSVDGGTTWSPTTEMVRIGMTDTGIIDLTSLRDVALGGDSKCPGSWYWDATSPYVWNKFTIADLRMTVAIPADHRLSAVAKLIDDLFSSSKGFDDLVLSPDLARVHADFVRQGLLDLRGMYELWLRWDSYPHPESYLDNPQATNKEVRENALRNDQDLLRSHVRRRLYMDGRLKGGGSLTTPRLCCEIPNGYQIQNVRQITGDSTESVIPVSRTVRAREFTQAEAGDGEQNVQTAIYLA